MRALLNGSDETYLFLFRMNKDCFKRLQTAFEPLWLTKRLGILRDVLRRKKRQLTCDLALALAIRFLVTTTEGVDACIHFGLMPSQYSVYLRHGLQILKMALMKFDVTSFSLPSMDTQKYYADVITAITDGELINVWGAVDGVCLYFERSGDMFIEGDHFSGFKKRPVKKLVCIFAPDGSICGATWGRGTMHDSDLFRPLAMKMELMQRDARQEPRICVLGDAAFPHSRVCFQATETYARDREQLKVLRRVRNFSEIGLGGIMKCCRRLYMKLPSDDPMQANLIITTSLLFMNYRIRVAQIGQLITMHYSLMGGTCSDDSSSDEDTFDESESDDGAMSS
jgi:hypothetical protein